FRRHGGAAPCHRRLCRSEQYEHAFAGRRREDGARPDPISGRIPLDERGRRSAVVSRLPHLPPAVHPRVAAGHERAARRSQPMIPQELAPLMQAAAQALKADDVFAAENAFRQIVSVNPRHADAWHMLAALVIRAGRGGEAIEPALRAHQLDRRNPDYLNTLGIAYGEAQQPEEAVRCFKRALKERPNRADTHFNPAKAYFKLKDLSQAERCCVRAHHLDPERPDIANNLAMIYREQGRYQDAEPLLARARERAPHDELLAINSAVVALARRGPDEAIECLKAFVASHPGSALVHEALAFRLLANGMFAEG